MKLKCISRISPLVLVFVPVLASAQFGEVDTFFENITGFIDTTLVPLVFAIAFIVFLWGVFQYFIMGGGDETKRADGRQYMLYGIIGFVVMVSIWGIVNVISGGLDLNEENLQVIPDAPTGQR